MERTKAQYPLYRTKDCLLQPTLYKSGIGIKKDAVPPF